MLSLAVVAMHAIFRPVASFSLSLPSVNQQFAFSTNRHAPQSTTSIICQMSHLSSVETIDYSVRSRSRTITSTKRDEPMITVRRARPDEIDYLSLLVASCFQKEMENVNDNMQEEGGALLPVYHWYIWDNFITRWAVYAGMVQRLVISSYRSGLQEGRGCGETIDNRSAHPLFVAEATFFP